MFSDVTLGFMGSKFNPFVISARQELLNCCHPKWSVTAGKQHFDQYFFNSALSIIFLNPGATLPCILKTKAPNVNEDILAEHNLYPFSTLNWDWVCQGGWDLSKEVLWMSVGQLASKLQAVKVGGLKKILPFGQSQTTHVTPTPEWKKL